MKTTEQEWWTHKLTPSQIIWLILEQQIGHEVTIYPDDAKNLRAAPTFFTYYKNGALICSQKPPEKEKSDYPTLPVKTPHNRDTPDS